MVDKFVVYNPTTKEYFKRGYGKTEDPAKARIYNKTNHARNSMNRKKWLTEGFDVFAITADFPMIKGEFDTYKAVNDGISIPFRTIVDYFRQMYAMDIAGTQPSAFPMSLDLIDVFYQKIKHMAVMGNGDNFMVTDKTFETDKPLHAMVGAEILKMFGYDTQGKRVAMFQVDWLDAQGLRVE
jgi:hypothetical protein